MAKKPVSKQGSSTHSSFLAYENYRHLKLSILVCALCILGYLWTDFEPNRNGGTWYGYGLGILATGLILWLTLLGVRKRWITQGHWSVKAWTSAHVYLGLSLIVIATLHTGFQFGWNIHTLAYVVMMGVIISGLFGIYFYAVLPRHMSNNRAQMSRSELLEEIGNLDRQLLEQALVLDDGHAQFIRDATAKTTLGGSMFRRLSGHDRKCPTRTALLHFRQSLQDKKAATQNGVLEMVGLLERKNALLSRTRLHIRYRTLLELWLYFHIPLTFALLAALTTHIVSVFFYS